MTEIYLIRHGEAEGNVFRRIHGQYDSLLTPRGHLQVKCVEKRFENIRVDACFSSDLTRTCLTARSVYVPKQLPLIRDSRFREVNLGIWEDLPFGWLEKFRPEEMGKFNQDPMHWQVPGAESFDDYTQRFAEGLMAAAESYDGGTVAVFTHGCMIRGFLMRYFFRNAVDKIPYSDNTGVCRIIYDKGSFRYEFINDNSHLPEALSTFALQRWWRATGNRKDANFYYLPYDGNEKLAVPQSDPSGFALMAMLHDTPVAVVSMGRPEGDCGRILGMTLQEGLDGRLYGDQLLGAAFSHFRRLGCRRLAINPGWYPDDIVNRYEFSDGVRSIDPHAFDWGNSHA